ncbi:ABC transporter ATP-binding protein [Thalassospira sp. NFXS8]|uniref:ABC transporter ATP-binding protein n=1 Tax=unclassified Thalassospira TaxID=2648997 RepID=UPI0032E021B2
MSDTIHSAHGTGKTGTVPPAIELRGIDKRFGAVHANNSIDLKVEKGTIHGIVGENGAGKSTLMSILYGFYQADAGTIHVDGTLCNINGSEDAIAVGIGMVHQHFMLVEPFSVLENVILGVEGGAVLREGVDKAREELRRLEREYSLDIDPDAIVGELSVGLQQRVEILKALYRGAEILILDEPTGVLTPQEADHLFRILGTLKQQGKTVVLITHKLREIMAATDNVSVMRQGEMVAHRHTADTSPEELSELMVGRKVLLRLEKGNANPQGTVLQVDNLCVDTRAGVRKVKNASFTVRAGEIVGIAGVSGNGQSELLEALGGIRAVSEGQVMLNGQDVTPGRGVGPAELRQRGVAHVPEDRHRMAMVTNFSAEEAAILGYQDDTAYQKGLLLDWGKVADATRHMMEEFDVRPVDPHLKAANFSGGNQQKLVLAREMMRDPDLLLVGQPTRGVDIGAIEFIHKRIVAMRDAGKAVLLVSVELDEIMSLSDRILVMCDGFIVGEVNAADANERVLGLMMAGVDPKQAEAEAGK